MRLSLIVLALLCIGSRTSAQELPTTPVSVEKIQIQVSDTRLRQLSQRYVAGNWATFVEDATLLLQPILALCPDTQCPNLDRDFIVLVWSATLPAASDPALLSVVLHDKNEEPYSRVLPGLKATSKARLFEVFLTFNDNASIQSYYISKPVPDPLVAQLPNVVGTFAGPVFAGLNAVVEQSTGVRELPLAGLLAPPETLATLTAIVRRVALPEPRAAVDVTFSARLPPTDSDITTGIDRLEQNLAPTVGGSASVWEVAHHAATELKRAVLACPRAELDQTSCRTSLDLALSAALATASHPLQDWERLALSDIADALRAHAATVRSKSVGGKAMFDNSPMTHLSFGLLTAWALDPEDNLRAKIDKDAVVRDPLPRALQIVTLNVSPWGYQEKTTRRWYPRSAPRYFVGVPFAPNVGIAAGASFMAVWNLGINVGRAWMWVPEPEGSLQFGDDLNAKANGVYVHPESLRRDPLKLGRVGTWFAGVSYNFK